ncbi:DNA-directed RNA polymerase, mitochondrial isoform X2 [Belonocnema kinseyi]|uniref:DNA-directed RNA polymerase, mitochondrial isoform X2 n=1 Tax=Belonocnema kinseyi TaxID=2817044 RepID=UPI00143CF001|nr:DNA-directed RNA polymerase, mitochondrial isoform X2 [Belonocnema kinseyi]
MYRFFKVRSFLLANANASTKPAYMQTSSYLCSFCKFYHSQISNSAYQQVKHHSTTINTAPISQQVEKKSKRRGVKYVELLEVTDSEANDRKTAVKKANYSNLSMFVLEKREKILKEIELAKKKKKNDREEISSEVSRRKENPLEVSARKEDPLKASHESAMSKELRAKKYKKEKREIIYKLNALAQQGKLKNLLPKKKRHINPSSEASKCLGSVENLDSDSLELAKESSVVEEEEEDEELDFDPREPKKKKKRAKQSNSQFQHDETLKPLLEAWKKEQQCQYILSYFDAYSKSGKLNEALETLFLFRERGYFYMKTIMRNILLYNFFLKECAARADLKNVKTLTKFIIKDSVKMVPETFAYIFECAARTEDPSKEIDFLSKMRNQMKKEEISFNDILTKPTFVADQKENVLRSVRLLEPNFEPVFEKPDLGYNCRLLENIFENRVPESPAKGLLSHSDLEERRRRQFEIEVKGQVDIKSVAMREEPNTEILNARQKVKELEETWRKDACQAFERNYEALKIRERGLLTTHLHPFLSVLDKEEYVEAIMREIKRLGETAEAFSPPVNYLSKELGQNIFLKYEARVKKNDGLIDKTLESYGEYCKWYLEGGNEENGRIKWQLLEDEMRQKGNTLNLKIVEWPAHVMKNVGRFLYDIIIKDLKMNVSVTKGREIFVPAFYVVFRHKFKFLKEEIKPHPGLTKLYRDSQPEFLRFDANLVPSLSPPKPWSSAQHGGYLITKSSLIRVPTGAVQQTKRLNEIPSKNIFPALDCLNQLGTIPWRVNISILDVALKVFQDGGSTKLNVPQPPSVLPAAPLLTEDSTEEERISISQTRMALKRRKNEMYSLWCDALYKLSLANHYKDEIFWLPHNMDFRGRVYPIPPHLSQMGSDFARSMLIFAQKKPLGPKGLDWLKIHVINLTGFKKKEPIPKRLEYANEILDDIIDSAEKPLTGKMWWSTSDEPWQTLAACMEISKAIKSPNPAEYMTGFPVHQDGSCNGLQHYAALGRDQIGAESVNLYPFDKPHDVYSDVVVLVEKTRKSDAEDGVEIAQVLEGYIQRKVIKQTIMTTVYGVTKFGAKLQIAKQLKDIEGFPDDKIWPASGYLVQKTFESLRSMFTSAKEIQDWFTECAKVICGVRGKSVEWVTPLGLPIIQPYTKPQSTGGYYHPAMDTFERPHATKQKNAFPPNFVHSLDSTHMMLTSLQCEQAGITFMSVHDCFWTHPCTVGTMNNICRKQFIALHSEPILENLSKYLLDHYAFSKEELDKTENVKFLEMRENMNKVLARVPAKGTFDLEKVQHSTYFFS